MKMDGNIRVATEAKYKELYNNMKANGAVDDFHELFFLCACLGYRKGVQRPVKKRDDRFWSRTITPREWACYYAMILEKNAFDYGSEKTFPFKVIINCPDSSAKIPAEIKKCYQVLPLSPFLGAEYIPSEFIFWT